MFEHTFSLYKFYAAQYVAVNWHKASGLEYGYPTQTCWDRMGRESFWQKKLIMSRFEWDSAMWINMMLLSLFS